MDNLSKTNIIMQGNGRNLDDGDDDFFEVSN